MTTKTRITPATDKQVGFIIRLLNEREAGDFAERCQDRIDSGTLTGAEASMAISWLLDRPRKPQEVETPLGWHLLDGTVYRVTLGKTGRPYAKIRTGKREKYAPGVVFNLNTDTILTLERAAALGHETGVCCICGATLTDPASVAAGIGPVCATKF